MSEVRPMSTEDTRAAQADAKARADAAAKDADKAHEDLMKERADRVKTAEEVTAFQGRQRPTPTPEEVLAAMSGKNADIKEPSGAVPQDMNDAAHDRLDPHKKKEATKDKSAKAEGDDASYKTRATHASAAQHQTTTKT